MKDRRFFKRVSPFVKGTTVLSKIDFYEWKRGRGLFVVFTDGTKMRSSYTLKELLSECKPEGQVVEFEQEQEVKSS